MYYTAKPSFQGTPRLDVGSSAMTDDTAISATATRHIHLYFEPSVQLPGTKLSPARQRRKIGMANATYNPTTPIVTTAKKATGTGAPLMSTLTNAGNVSSAATAAASTTL